MAPLIVSLFIPSLFAPCHPDISRINHKLSAGATLRGVHVTLLPPPSVRRGIQLGPALTRGVTNTTDNERELQDLFSPPPSTTRPTAPNPRPSPLLMGPPAADGRRAHWAAEGERLIGVTDSPHVGQLHTWDMN